ncbi:hypothetical protein [Pseudomonas sp.]|uniref:hypothetical protein n=1 Tax=Pseudomonas sp. TaxID=306 RepID=UPI003D0DE8C6
MLISRHLRLKLYQGLKVPVTLKPDPIRHNRAKIGFVRKGATAVFNGRHHQRIQPKLLFQRDQTSTAKCGDKAPAATYVEAVK